eukprot:3650075-Pyramimonas_sp.AAC.1
MAVALICILSSRASRYLKPSRGSLGVPSPANRARSFTIRLLTVARVAPARSGDLGLSGSTCSQPT